MRRWCLTALVGIVSAALYAQGVDERVAMRNLQRAVSLLDSAMTHSLRGTPDNRYIADVVNLESGWASGPSDVWPYTAAIEAHCAVLEAMQALKPLSPPYYDTHYNRLIERLECLIDNLAYYRGTYALPSYASQAVWSVYAVPRAAQRNMADVAGDEYKKTVYDDQMWLARELIRAYRLTGKQAYLADATHLADYAIDGWDCWRDASGDEYGGITWGPGYNSKHACSNGPLIQPLVWLHQIYSTAGKHAECLYHYRDEHNRVVVDTVDRAQHYLEFAHKIYAWQRSHLLDPSTGVYHDMLGADNTLRYTRQGDAMLRRHVATGPAVGTAYTYNTGTMLAGSIALFATTGEEHYRADALAMVESSFAHFSVPHVIEGVSYRKWPTDSDALHGFNAWFANVLLRAHVDVALALPADTGAVALIESFEQNLDYAFDHHLYRGQLPIHLLGGWPDERVTKPFHQCAFAAEYAMLALWRANR